MANFYYSMVVDDPLDHPYKASILTNSLIHFGKVDPEHIVVQFTDRVRSEIVEEFERLGFKVNIVSPYLDQKYCNKISQMEFLSAQKNFDVRGIFLLDIDLFVLEPITVPDTAKVWGKIVDDQNPPLSDLYNIFLIAGIAAPGETDTDWKNGRSLSTNLNGGLLYIPAEFAARLHMAWRKCAEFLFERQNLFADSRYEIHIDQISFAMALASEKIPYGHLPANVNFPCHSRLKPSTYDPHRVISVLHYHSCLDEFGLIEPAYDNSQHEEFRKSLQRANAALSKFDCSNFFDAFKKHEAKRRISARPPAGKTLQEIEMRFRLDGKRLKLIIHAGTPKTGTSSLQWTLGTNRAALCKQGIWYPKPSNTPMPKHQYLVHTLRAGSVEQVIFMFEEALREMPIETHTIFMTTEGIYNHWWDFKPANLEALKSIASIFDFEMWVCFREPKEFAESLYAQYLKNPSIPGVTGNAYGLDIDFAQAMRDRWFRRHLDYLGFIYECHELFGAERLKAFAYGPDIAETLVAELLDSDLRVAQRKNTTLRAVGIELTRMLNRFALPQKENDRAQELIEGLSELVGVRSEKFAISSRDRELVTHFTEKSWKSVQPKLIRRGNGSK